MSKKIKVIMCPVDREPYMAEIEDSLEALQQAVGGYIECLGVTTDCVLICNEEGRVRNMPVNHSVSWLMPYGIYGDALLCGADGPEFADVPETGRDMLLKASRRIRMQEAKADA